MFWLLPDRSKDKVIEVWRSSNENSSCKAIMSILSFYFKRSNFPLRFTIFL
jgi:hypothetical protein